MRQAWRWFGPDDPVSLDHVRQAGATDVVSALHHLPPGRAWTPAEVERHRDLVETAPPGRSALRWSVVESIPVPDDVKRLGRGARASIEAWIASLEAVAGAGIRTVCYNFMPVLDWTRTDLDWPLPTGATALRFDQVRFAAYGQLNGISLAVVAGVGLAAFLLAVWGYDPQRGAIGRLRPAG